MVVGLLCAESAGQMKKMPLQAYLALAIAFFVVSFFSGYGSYLLYTSEQSFMNLPTTPGIILSIDVKAQPMSFSMSRGTGGTDIVWMVLVSYEYSVSGKTYTGHRISNVEPQESVSTHAQPSAGMTDYLVRYPVGKTVQVRYHRKDPQRSLLEVDSSGFKKFMYVTLCALIIALSLLARYFVLPSGAA